MRWKKLGQIFEFNDSTFKGEFLSFAQAPQALEYEKFVRFYFSTRKVSQNGKFVSIVQYVDMSKDFKNIVGRSKGIVVPLGELGTFDEHGIFPFSVFKHNNEVWGYSNGWNRRTSVSVDTAIGLAISRDNGETFVKLGTGPVLGPSLHEPFLVCDPFVRVFDDVFHMWYIYGTSWKVYQKGLAPDRTYVIAHATSVDGITWEKEGRPIITQNYAEECQALPSIINIDDRYHMFFCHRNSFDFRDNPKNAYKLGYAYSDDLKNWTRDDSVVVMESTSGEWDSNMKCYPHIFKCNSKIYLAYNGNEFGKSGFGLAEMY